MNYDAKWISVSDAEYKFLTFSIDVRVCLDLLAGFKLLTLILINKTTGDLKIAMQPLWLPSQFPSVS